MSVLLFIIDTVTPIHGSLSSTHLPASHACVRTCISKSAGASQSVLRPVIPVIRSTCTLSSLQSVISEYYKRCLSDPHEFVSDVSSPIVVYTPVSPSVTYAQAVKSCVPSVCGNVDFARRGVARTKPNPRLLMQKVVPNKRAPTYQQSVNKALVQERVRLLRA